MILAAQKEVKEFQRISLSSDLETVSTQDMLEGMVWLHTMETNKVT